ncbi:MAG: EamA family transporter RarD [Actinobacteria bacterium]|nr:EamA family transporter RarD [Micrococcales bacterium]MCB0902908.1 EamA family transporter RarD [Actinomycetota bacterium]MCB9427468.1 EamA family transporter RarD [Actinomycetota bacterium]
MDRELRNDRAGLIYGIGAYSLWGLFPLYWPLLEPASSWEILAHRMVWSFVFLLIINIFMRTWSRVRDALADPRTRLLLLVAAALVSVNWGTYIWAVNNGYVVESSLGYFINPLVSVALGVFVLGETLRRLQWIAVGIAAVAVGVLTLSYGRPPWIALILAFSFGIYGLVRKQAGVQAVPALTVETGFQAPFALIYFGVLAATGTMTFGASPGNSVMLMTAGIATTIPLLLFGAAAIRLPLVALGLLQYLAPVLQFVIGITVFGEHMPLERWLGFVLVWFALSVFTFDVIRNARRPIAEPPL